MHDPGDFEQILAPEHVDHAGRRYLSEQFQFLFVNAFHDHALKKIWRKSASMILEIRGIGKYLGSLLVFKRESANAQESGLLPSSGVSYRSLQIHLGHSCMAESIDHF